MGNHTNFVKAEKAVRACSRGVSSAPAFTTALCRWIASLLLATLLMPAVSCAQSAGRSAVDSSAFFFTGGLAAARAWNYERSLILFQKVADGKSIYRGDAARRITEIRRITSTVKVVPITDNTSWEQLSRQYFMDDGFASRLAMFNQRFPEDKLTAGDTITIPLIHSRFYTASAIVAKGGRATPEELRSAVGNLENVRELDPDYPLSEQRLEAARTALQTSLENTRLDSLEKTSELYAARYEFTEAIRLLEEAQEVRPDSEREKKIKRLAKRRQDYLPVLFELGNERFIEDDLVGAVAAWSKVFDVDPDYRDVKLRLERARSMLALLEKMESDTSLKKNR